MATVENRLADPVSLSGRQYTSSVAEAFALFFVLR